MTARPPVCDGHQGDIAPGVDYATIITPGAPDRHLCRSCASLVWRYLPELVRHRHLQAAADRPGGRTVRERALRLDLPEILKTRRPGGP